VAQFGGAPSVRSRFEELAGAESSLVLFHEYIPHSLSDWLDDATGRAETFERTPTADVGLHGQPLGRGVALVVAYRASRVHTIPCSAVGLSEIGAWYGSVRATDACCARSTRSRAASLGASIRSARASTSSANRARHQRRTWPRHQHDPFRPIDQVGGWNKVAMAGLLGCYSKRTSWTKRLSKLPDLTFGTQCVTQRRQRQTVATLPPDDVEARIDDYRAGATVYDLATRFGIHRTSVSQHLRRNGVRMRHQGLEQDQVDTGAPPVRPGPVPQQDRECLGADTGRPGPDTRGEHPSRPVGLHYLNR
jgi:hypothetical protein